MIGGGIFSVSVLSATFAFAKPVATASIVSEKKIPDRKRALEVRLDRRIPREQLVTLANSLKGSDKSHYDRTFILYYLPYQRVGSGAWASSHFTPELKVEILGASINEVKKLKTHSITTGWQEPAPLSKKPRIWGEAQPVRLSYGGEVVGEWIHELPGNASNKITIFRKNGAYYLNRYFVDGTQDTVKLRMKKVSAGLLFEEEQPNSSGDYYVVNRKKDLEFHDTDDGMKARNVMALPPQNQI